MARQPSTNREPTVDAVTVALDVGPLHGPRTGVGNAVEGTVLALDAQPSVDVEPYVVSMRARLEPHVRRLPLPAALAQRWWPHRSPPLDRLLGRPDVVHGTNYVVPPTRCPRVVSVYDCWFLDHPDSAAPDVGRAARVLRRSVDDGATVVVSSKATAERVRRLLDTDRVRTIPLGPPTRPVPQQHAAPVVAVTAGLEQHPFILAIGTIERRKNIPTLIRAFGRVAQEHETVRLVIAGRMGDDADAVARRVAQLDPAIAARVSLPGPVDAPTKQWLLGHAAVLAYPSLDEGFGFPILEAAAAGVAVVASTAGSIPEVAGNSALMSPPTDVEALAANLYWVISNDEMRAKLVARGTRNLARFSWDRTGADLAALYHELANGAVT